MVALGLLAIVLIWGGWVLHYAITQYPMDERLKAVTRR
ncbi:MAG: hypothetical protein ANABAC_1294 [Anaerolineae bacterium]|nr:MAG: hypothetical protein ANABAC_1294 [Anaerolineae bacterium]